jgi:hypothetical protein
LVPSTTVGGPEEHWLATTVALGVVAVVFVMVERALSLDFASGLLLLLLLLLLVELAL